MASNRRVVVKQTYLECTCCGHINTIFRKRHKMREKNHIKHMHCPSCKEIQAFRELQEDAFLPEWLREPKDNTAEL